MQVNFRRFKNWERFFIAVGKELRLTPVQHVNNSFNVHAQVSDLKITPTQTPGWGHSCVGSCLGCKGGGHFFLITGALKDILHATECKGTHTDAFRHTSHTLVPASGGRPTCVQSKYPYEQEKGWRLPVQTFIKSTAVSMRLFKTSVCVCVCARYVFVTMCVYFSGWRRRRAFPFHLFPRCCFQGTSLLCLGVNDQNKWL